MFILQEIIHIYTIIYNMKEIIYINNIFLLPNLYVKPCSGLNKIIINLRLKKYCFFELSFENA